MSLLQELATDIEVKALIEEIENELNGIEEEYQQLVHFTSLYEGVLDSLPDDIIQQVGEIEKRLDAVARARVLLTKLKKTGGYSPPKIKQMRDRVSKNAGKLRKLLAQTKDGLSKVEVKVDTEVEKLEDTSEPVVSGDTDLRDLPPKTVMTLRKIASGRFNADAMDDMEAMEVLGDLESLGLIKGDNQITDKGQRALKKLKTKKQSPDYRASGQERKDRETAREV